MITRFNCYIPGTWRILWLRMRCPNEWAEMVRPTITDTKTGYRFQVTEEEDAAMMLMSEITSEASLSEAFASRKILKRALESACDDLLLAMYERRHGDETAWSRFAGMSRDDWRVWWADLEAKARVEARR